MTYVIFKGLVMLRKSLFFLKLLLVGLIVTLLANSIIVILAETMDETQTFETVEIRDYDGKNLSSIDDFFENSIEGPQYIDALDYRLFVTGLVTNALSLTYDEVVNNYRHFEKVVTLHCVEGWKVTILWDGIMLKDLLAVAGVDPNASTVILYAYDGYSTSVPLDYIIDNNILLAYKMNNVTLSPERGFPFQLVAESKLGYKWIKWIVSIELSNNEEYKGYWEMQGYSNDADVGEGYFYSAIPEFSSWIILPLFVTATITVIIYRKKLSPKKAY